MLFRTSLLAALGATVPALGCYSGPKPCIAPKQCDEGYECLAHQCQVMGREPVPPNTLRAILRPHRIAIFDPNVHEESSLPARALLGGSTSPSTVYLTFPLESYRTKTITSAFLLLTPAASAQLPASVQSISVRRAREPWTAESISSGHPPRRFPGSAKGLAYGQAVARVDVTELLRAELSRGQTAYGFAVCGTNEDAGGFPISTGAGLGKAPALELYIQTPPKTTRRTRR